jgi:protocatechuate 3,4-dioxygenase beta subunit
MTTGKEQRMRPRRLVHSTPRRAATTDLGRRRALAAVSACAATLALPNAFAQAAACIVTADSGEGPFYFDPKLVRSDVTSGRIGAPLDIAIQITRARDCAPLAGARLDLWQADAVGLYSGYRDQPAVGGIPTEPAVGATFLRGTQFADADGWVRFKTIYPSWYGGRTPHVHFKVLLDAREPVASQIFFDDEVNAEVFEHWDPYREHAAKRTAFNDSDRFLDTNDDGRIDGVFCEVVRYDSRGVAATAVVTVADT